MMNSPLLTPLVDAATLRALLDGATPPVLLDCSFDLADTSLGERQYREAHLPGAQHVHLDDDLSGSKTGPDGRFRGRHPLPTREAFAATASALGIGPDTPVVVYDRQGSAYAVRAWWLLRWLGHDAVAVLDGGLDAWRAAGGVVASGEPPARRRDAAPYPTRAPAMPTLDADAVVAQLGRAPLIDARAPERFRGEVEPFDAKAGHIPGARNRWFKDNLGADGRFKPAATLRAEFDALLGGAAPEVVTHQCGSGVNACHNLLAMEAAGLRGSRLYAGSWSEWSSDPARPVAVGG
jgi:thiosulfate/3-mercaptopyruvate sulfurtransferase